MMKDHTPYSAQLADHIRKGWEVVSEGPSGAQLKRGKRMRIMTMLFIALGFFALFVQPVLGGILLVLGVLNHAMTKDQSKFLPKEE